MTFGSIAIPILTIILALICALSAAFVVLADEDDNALAMLGVFMASFWALVGIGYAAGYIA